MAIGHDRIIPAARLCPVLRSLLHHRIVPPLLAIAPHFAPDAPFLDGPPRWGPGAPEAPETCYGASLKLMSVPRQKPRHKPHHPRQHFGYCRRLRRGSADADGTWKSSHGLVGCETTARTTAAPHYVKNKFRAVGASRAQTRAGRSSGRAAHFARGRFSNGRPAPHSQLAEPLAERQRSRSASAVALRACDSRPASSRAPDHPAH